jgi:hypothetical protein
LPLEQIVDATVDLRALQDSGQTKYELRQLQIVTRDGQHTIELESGTPFSSFWNVLKGIAAGNRGRSGSDLA